MSVLAMARGSKRDSPLPSWPVRVVQPGRQSSPPSSTAGPHLVYPRLSSPILRPRYCCLAVSIRLAVVRHF